MDVFESREWDKATNRVFDELGYLLEESGVRILYHHEIGGPGGDWDIYKVTIEGCDSGDEHHVVATKHIGAYDDERYPDLQVLAQELAYYIADSQGGEVEEEGSDSFSVWF